MSLGNKLYTVGPPIVDPPRRDKTLYKGHMQVKVPKICFSIVLYKGHNS